MAPQFNVDRHGPSTCAPTQILRPALGFVRPTIEHDIAVDQTKWNAYRFTFALIRADFKGFTAFRRTQIKVILVTLDAADGRAQQL